MTDAQRRKAGRVAVRMGSGVKYPSRGCGGETPASPSELTVLTLQNGGYAVAGADHLPLIYPFDTQADAWRWIDRHECEPISPAEKKSDWIVGKILGGAA